VSHIKNYQHKNLKVEANNENDELRYINYSSCKASECHCQNNPCLHRQNKQTKQTQSHLYNYTRIIILIHSYTMTSKSNKKNSAQKRNIVSPPQHGTPVRQREQKKGKYLLTDAPPTTTSPQPQLTSSDAPLLPNQATTPHTTGGEVTVTHASTKRPSAPPKKYVGTKLLESPPPPQFRQVQSKDVTTSSLQHQQQQSKRAKKTTTSATTPPLQQHSQLNVVTTKSKRKQSSGGSLPPQSFAGTSKAVPVAEISLELLAKMGANVPDISEPHKQKRSKRVAKKQPSIDSEQVEQPADWSGHKNCPGGWKNLIFGSRTPLFPGLNLLSMKTPLGKNVAYKYYKEFQVYSQEIVKELGMDICCIVDISGTNKQRYNKDDLPANTQMHKIPTDQQMLPSEQQLEQFCNLIDTCIKEHNNKLTLVHCTYGVNYTGYFLSYYLASRRAVPVEVAVSYFAVSRKVAMYDAELLDSLYKRLGGGTPCFTKRSLYDKHMMAKYHQVIERRKQDQLDSPVDILDYPQLPNCYDMSKFAVVVQQHNKNL
jgi:hypothetical protein